MHVRARASEGAGGVAVNVALGLVTVVCPFAREAHMLMDEVEGHVSRGEFFDAGVWWHEALRPINQISDRQQQLEARRRHSGLSERIVAQERARACAAE
jgi:hypothetical protein